MKFYAATPIHPMILIAHRGESTYAVENSLASISLAWKQGVKAVEVDVRLTSDNQIAVIHDAHTGRVTDQRKVVAKSTLQELQALSLKLDGKQVDESIPTLAEVLQTVPTGRKLIIEVKSGKRIIPHLVKLLQTTTLETDQIEVICFNKRVLAKLKAALPMYCMYWLLNLDYRRPHWLLLIRPKQLAKKVQRMGLDGVDVWAGKMLDQKFIAEFKKLRLTVYAWTVNDLDQALALKKAGLDGLTTDKAARMHGEFSDIQKSKTAIIAIHGLGNKPAKEQLEKWWIQAIKEGFAGTEHEDLDFEFKLVYWADLVYQKPLRLEETGEFQLHEDYQPSTGKHEPEEHSVRLKVMGFIKDQLGKLLLNDDYTLNYKGLTDVIMKRYYRDFDIYFAHKESGFTEREQIMQRVIDAITTYADRKVMVIGHSMGSIIAYDTLNNRLKDHSIDTLCTLGSPLGIPTVLNKIALENNQYYDKDNRIKTPKTVKKVWHNLKDPLDKVAFNYNLANHFTANAYGVKPVDHLVINDYEKDGEANPHKSYGYLRTKAFSDLLGQFLSE